MWSPMLNYKIFQRGQKQLLLWSPPRNEDHDQMCMCAPTHTTHGPADGAHPISMFRANALRAEVARDWAQRTKTLREFMSSSLNMVVEPVFHDQTSSSHSRRSLNYFLDTEKGYRIWRGHFALTDVSYSLLVTARSSEDPGLVKSLQIEGRWCYSSSYLYVSLWAKFLN